MQLKLPGLCDKEATAAVEAIALKVQLVFMTKCWRGVLRDAHLSTLREEFTSVCGDFGGGLAGMDRQDDHVHLFVAYLPPVVFIASSLKASPLGGCINATRRAHHTEHLWSPPYFAASAGGAPAGDPQAVYPPAAHTPGWPAGPSPGTARLEPGGSGQLVRPRWARRASKTSLQPPS
jgi:putative transposase